MTKRNAEIVGVVSMVSLGILIFHFLWQLQVWFIEHPLKMPEIVINFKEK